MAPKGWSYDPVHVGDSAEKKIPPSYTNLSPENVFGDINSSRTKRPSRRTATDPSVQKSESKHTDHEQRLPENQAAGKNVSNGRNGSTAAKPSRATRSIEKKRVESHSETPIREAVSDTERLAIADELESVIVVERTPKRAKTKSGSSQAAVAVKKPVYHASEVDKLERPQRPVLKRGELPEDEGIIVETSQTSNASFNQTLTGNEAGGLIGKPETPSGQPKRRSVRTVRHDGAANISKPALGTSESSATSLNGELAQNNSATSKSQRSELTLPSTGFHDQRRLHDSQSTSPPLGQTPQRQLRSSSTHSIPKPELQYSFRQSTKGLQDESSIFQEQESYTVFPSTTAFSNTLPGSSNCTSHLSNSNSTATFQINTSTASQQDERAHNLLIIDTEDMADTGTRQISASELDDDNSLVLSDLDSQEDFTEVEAAFNLISQQEELAAEQKSNMTPDKSRPPGQKKPTSRALRMQKKQIPKRPRGRPPKDKNELQKAAARAKAVTIKKLPAKPKQPKVPARTSGRTKNVDEEDDKDAFHPGKGVGSAMSGLGMSLRDRSMLKAPTSHSDLIAATVDLMQKPASNTGKTRASRASATPPTVGDPSQKKATRTPKQTKKPPPKSTESAEPNPSPPHDSGFSEIASTDDDQASSDFLPPSSASSDSPQTSIVSPSSPEEEVEDEDDVIESSSAGAAAHRERKSHYCASNVTVKDADARTNPPLGPELRGLAHKAWVNGQIAKRWNPEVARRVDGIWMAPDKCDNCRTKKRDNCDRAYPCSVCVKMGKSCNVRTVMTRTACRDNLVHEGVITPLHLNAPMVSQNGDETWDSTKQAPPMVPPQKRKLEDSNKVTAKTKGGRGKMPNNGPSRSNEISQHLKAPHTFQNGDGSWNVVEQAFPASNVDKRKRKYAGGSEAAGNSSSKKHRLAASGYSSSEETDYEVPINSRKPLVRSRKERKTPRTYTPYHQSQQENLPAPYGEPPAWASKRQQLCETLPYYRAYMSGAYMHDGLVRAFLIDKEVRERDVFDEEVVITRCGGGRTLDDVTGKMLQSSDQEKSACGLGFERAREMHTPVAIIAGQGNSKSKTKLPHYYNVLDWFHVTDVWIEMVEGFRTWCVRLEKIRLNEKSWWAKADSALLSPYRDLNAIKAESEDCGRCGKTSKTIFGQGWTCLTVSCEEYFAFDPPIDDRNLVYTEAFLNERTAYSGMTPGPLAPPLVTEADMIIAGNTGTEANFKRGIVCPLCKGCSRRKDWLRWRCETAGCTFTHSFPFRTVDVKNTMSESARHRRVQNYEREFGIKMEAKRLGAYNVFEYGVPGPNDEIVGVLRLFKSTGAINRQPDGPDDLFRLMQERDFDLRRRPVRQSNSSGEVITNHFATNWGAPYKFVVAQSSRGFSEAPTVIVKALKRLTWAGEQTLTDVGEPFHPFNELLSIGYFEDCSIGYHDDGESTLGPTVATLSLGASATMSLRPKAKAEVGITSRNAKGTKTPIIRVTLEHGDMVIMHGSGVQQYYEHEVVPHGILRFALTCRYIKPDALESDAEREEARIKGALPEGHEQYNYDGDENDIFAPEDIKKAEKDARMNAMMRAFNDVAVVCKAGASQGDSDELSQMRDLMGDQLRNLMGQFENEALAPGVVAEPMCRSDAGEEVDIAMPNAP